MTTAQKNDAIEEVLRYYGINTAEFFEPEKGYRNHSYKFMADGKPANLIIYKNEPLIEQKIRQANRLSNYLASKGLPSRRSLDKRVVMISSAAGPRYAALYEYLPGKVIPWESYTSRHLKLLGSTMADMHSLLADLPQEDLQDIEDELGLILARMRSYFSGASVQQAMHQKLQILLSPKVLDFYIELFAATKKIDPRQPLHMDYVRGNILFSGSKENLEVTGIIDFEKAAYGHKVFDIARTLAFLYVDSKYKKSEEVFNRFLVSGYIRSGAGSINKIPIKASKTKTDLLESLIVFYWLYDLYKFMRHNPYESLPQNEHFLRTKKFLLDQKVVYSTSRKESY